MNSSRRPSALFPTAICNRSWPARVAHWPQPPLGIAATIGFSPKLQTQHSLPSRFEAIFSRSTTDSDGSFGFEFKFGSGTGIRTLNLAVNRSLQPVQKWRSEFAEYRRVSPSAAVCHRLSPALLTHGLRNRCPANGFEDRDLHIREGHQGLSEFDQGCCDSVAIRGRPARACRNDHVNPPMPPAFICGQPNIASASLMVLISVWLNHPGRMLPDWCRSHPSR